MKFILTLFTFFIASNSFSQTLQFYLPKDNGQFLDLGYSISGESISHAQNSSVTESDISKLKLRFDKAISPQMSFGFQYTSADLSSDTTDFNPRDNFSGSRNGAEDIPLYIQGLSGVFYWKATYFYASEKATERDGDENFSTGSHFGIDLGILITLNSGVRLRYIPQYTYDIEQNSPNDDNEYTQGSETVFTLFKEFASEGSLYGAEISYITEAESEIVDGDSGAEIEIGQRNFLEVKFYPAWTFGSTQLISNISYKTLLNVDNFSSTVLSLGLDLRFNSNLAFNKAC